MLQWTWKYKYFFEILISILVDKYPKSGVLESNGSSVFNFFGGISILHSLMAAPFKFPLTVLQGTGSSFSASWPTVVDSWSWVSFHIPGGLWRNFFSVLCPFLNLIFLVFNWIVGVPFIVDPWTTWKLGVLTFPPPVKNPCITFDSPRNLTIVDPLHLRIQPTPGRRQYFNPRLGNYKWESENAGFDPP